LGGRADSLPTLTLYLSNSIFSSSHFFTLSFLLSLAFMVDLDLFGSLDVLRFFIFEEERLLKF